MNNKPAIKNQNDLTLSDFPPVLRKVLKYKLNNESESITFKEICLRLGVNYESFKHAKWKYREKHNKDMDFYLDQHRMDVIKRGTFDTYQSITLQAQDGKLGQQKLIAELRGDLKNKLEIDHKVIGLHTVFAPGSDPTKVPTAIKRIREKNLDKDGIQIIDVDLDD